MNHQNKYSAKLRFHEVAEVSNFTSKLVFTVLDLIKVKLRFDLGPSIMNFYEPRAESLVPGKSLTPLRPNLLACECLFFQGELCFDMKNFLFL